MLAERPRQLHSRWLKAGVLGRFGQAYWGLSPRLHGKQRHSPAYPHVQASCVILIVAFKLSINLT